MMELLELRALFSTLSVTPGQSIQAAVNAAANNDTITISAGTYTGAINLAGKSGLTLQADAQAAALPGDFNTDGTVDTLDFNTLKAGWGVKYSTIDFNYMAANWGKASPPAGPVIIDAGGAEKLVTGGTNITFRNLIFQNADGLLQSAHAAVTVGSGATIDGCTFRDNSATALAVSGASGATITNSTFRNNGQSHFVIIFSRDVLVENSTFIDANMGWINPRWRTQTTIEGYTAAMNIGGVWKVNPDFEASNKIWSSDRVTFRNNDFGRATGPAGPWPDFKNTNITIEDNYIHDARGIDAARFYQGEGIRLELSPSAGGFTVRNNRIENNTGAGVTLTSVRDVTISGNSFAGNYTGVLLRRDDGRGGLFNILASGNTYAGSKYAVWRSSSPWGNVVIDGAVLA